MAWPKIKKKQNKTKKKTDFQRHRLEFHRYESCVTWGKPSKFSELQFLVHKTEIKNQSSQVIQRCSIQGTSLVAQWLRLRASTAGGTVSIPGGDPACHAQGNQKKKCSIQSTSPDAMKGAQVIIPSVITWEHILLGVLSPPSAQCLAHNMPLTNTC